LQVIFANERLKAELESDKAVRRRWGEPARRQLRARLDELAAADRLETMRTLPGHVEELAGDRAGQLSLRLPDGQRLLFEVADEPIPRKSDGGLDWRMVRAVRVMGVENYHD
jgi:proteic killer suppression protein